MPNAGTARADFPGGNATTLFKSIKKILSLPSKTKIYICHDYPKMIQLAGLKIEKDIKIKIIF